jgi:enoyl-[acyl-carrier protein] reductase III
MPGVLAGKVALVTGAARGIGRAVALKLAREGCDVAVNYYNSADEAETLCAEIRALGRRAVAIQGSVGIPDSVDEIFAEFGRHFDRLDILVSNAASGVLKPTVEMTLKHWRWCMETNALALNLLAQRAVPMMPAGGRILAMSSLGSLRALPNYGFIGRRRPRSRRWCARSRRSSGRAASASTRSAPAWSTPTRSPTSPTARSCSSPSARARRPVRC